MNVFYLHDNTKTCAEMHLDKHCVKMILEYAQLLSTAHRMLSGNHYIDKSSGRSIQRWRISDERTESILFKASHINHPSAIWARSNTENYHWLGQLLLELCAEYTHRYKKVHSVDASGLAYFLSTYYPKNIPVGAFTEPPPAMPDYCKISGDSVSSYRKYYLLEKRRFAVWTNRIMPDWFSLGLTDFNQACLIENDIKRNRIISKPIAAETV